jgi:hypothetical protein
VCTQNAKATAKNDKRRLLFEKHTPARAACERVCFSQYNARPALYTITFHISISKAVLQNGFTCVFEGFRGVVEQKNTPPSMDQGDGSQLLHDVQQGSQPVVNKSSKPRNMAAR